MDVRKVGIVDFARSPISKAKDGALNALTCLEIAGHVVKKLVARNDKIPTQDIEMLSCGCDGREHVSHAVRDESRSRKLEDHRVVTGRSGSRVLRRGRRRRAG